MRVKQIFSKKRVKGPIAVIGLLSFISCYFYIKSQLYFKYQMKSSIVSSVGELVIPDLKKKVTIFQDQHAVGYIEALDDDDLFLAVGYYMASKRLWQMMLLKMLSQGRLSEILGKEFLDVDIYMRTLGLKHYAKANIENLPQEYKDMLGRFSKGVNHYLKLNQNHPIEFLLTGFEPEEWSGYDSLCISYLMNLGLSANFLEEISYLNISKKLGGKKASWLFPIYPDEDLPFKEAQKTAEYDLQNNSMNVSALLGIFNKIKEYYPLNIPASNNWALAKEKTKGKNTILANDTHLAISIPSIWIVIHLKSPAYRAAGFILPGTPFVNIGFNGSIAWSVSMVSADNQDLYIEKTKTIKGHTHYLFNNKWRPVRTQKETIKIKSEKEHNLLLEYTHRGPLIDRIINLPRKLPFQHAPFRPNYSLSLKTTLSKDDKSLIGFYRMAVAKTMPEFRRALSNLDSFYFNVIYADKQNIALQITGKYPVRKKGKGKFPSPGESDLYDWVGYVPFAELPYVLNPEKGYLATANNRTTDKKYPHHLSNSWHFPERSERLSQIFTKRNDFSFIDMKEIHQDNYSLIAQKTREKLFSEPLHQQILTAINNWNGKIKQEKAFDALDIIKSFDFLMDKDSYKASLIAAFFHCFTRNTFLDELGGEHSTHWKAFQGYNITSYSGPWDHLIVRGQSPFWDDINTERTEKKADIIAESLYDAIIFCQGAMGQNKSSWAWGKLHKYYWQHDITKKAELLKIHLNRGPLAAGGNVDTINVGGYNWGDNFDAWVIPIMRMIVDFNLEEPMYVINHSGQSGNPGSSHYDDMIKLWYDGKYLLMPFKKKNIKKQYLDQLILKAE